MFILLVDDFEDVPSRGDILCCACCLYTVIVVTIVAAAAILVGVRSSNLVVQRSSCAEACSMFDWDKRMCYLGLMLMISG